MSQKTLITVRNLDRMKVDVLFDSEGWLEGEKKSGAYTLRQWKLNHQGIVQVNEIKLNQTEVDHIVKFFKALGELG